MDERVSVLMLMWRQINAASGKSTGFSLEEMEELEELRKKVGVIRE